MAERPDYPCPHTGEPCQRHCPGVACSRDLDDASPLDDVAALLGVPRFAVVLGALVIFAPFVVCPILAAVGALP